MQQMPLNTEQSSKLCQYRPISVFGPRCVHAAAGSSFEWRTDAANSHANTAARGSPGKGSKGVLTQQCAIHLCKDSLLQTDHCIGAGCNCVLVALSV
jgi:hypothetical protein